MNIFGLRVGQSAALESKEGLGNALFKACLLVLASSSLLPSGASAQSSSSSSSSERSLGQLTFEGVVDDIDSGRRGPVVSVRPVVRDGLVQLLADAFVPNDDFKKYPIRFDFFVNRQLFASQIRSVELPGPVGINVTSQQATVPFNYTVVATVLHPNRQYLTVLNAAVFTNDLQATYDCTLTLTTALGTDGTDETLTFVANQVAATQNSDTSFSIAFTDVESSPEGRSASLAAGINFASDNTATSTLQLTLDGQPSLRQVTGSVALSDGSVTEFNLASSDGFTTFTCSQ